MSNYTKTTDFAAKDSLPTGDSGKIIRGAEFETEFDAIATAIATKADTAGPTFTGTLTFETISDGTIGVTAFVDEDDMSSDSATLVPTQQSVKAYVDAQVTAQDLDFQANTGGALSIDLDSETLTFTGGAGIDTSGALNEVTFAIDSTVTTLTGTQTLTNKTLTAPVISTISNTGTITLPTSTDTLVGRDTTDTLTNKTLTSAVLNTGVSGTAVLDEDDMSSNSATQLATQQSIKAYVDATVAATNELVEDTTPQLGGTLDLNGNNITGTGNIDVTGTVTADGLTVDGTDTEAITSQLLKVRNSTTGEAVTIGMYAKADNGGDGNTGSITFDAGATGLASDSSLRFSADHQTDLNPALKIDGNRDISFYEDTGTNAKLFWDASTERLGIGTTSPSTGLHISNTGPVVTLTDTDTSARNIVSGASGSGSLLLGADEDNGVANSVVSLRVDGSEKAQANSTGFDVTGTLTTDTLDVDSVKILSGQSTTPTNDASPLIYRTSGHSSYANGDLVIQARSSASRDIYMLTGTTTPVNRLQVNGNGDISFYEDTGTTAKLFWDASAESLGIGTTSPASLASLHLKGAGGTELHMESGDGASTSVIKHNQSTDALEFYPDGSLALTLQANNQAIFESNVGIGTSSPDRLLNVVGTDTIIADFENTTATGNGRIAVTTGSNTAYFTQFGQSHATTPNLTQISAPSETRFINSGVTVATMKSSGNLGIGTTSPSVPLHVVNASPELRLQDSDDNGYLALNHNGANSYVSTTQGGILFRTGGTTERMRIDSSGNVGIGTSSPRTLLHVTGLTGDDDPALGSSTAPVFISNTANSYGLNIGVNNAGAGWLQAQSNTASTSYDLLLNPLGGNVGIGESAPERLLHVKSLGTQVAALIESTSTIASRLSLMDANTTSSAKVGIGATGDTLGLYAGGSAKATIDADGNLLVGKTSDDNTTTGMVVGQNGFTKIVRTSGTANVNTVLQLNRLATDGEIARFQKDGSTVGSISVLSSRLYIGSGDTGIKFSGADDLISPIDASDGTGRDAAIDLGSSSTRFKDLYLSGDVYATNIKGQNDANTKIEFLGSDVTRFVQGGSEKARIDSSGNLLVGTTSTTADEGGIVARPDSDVSNIYIGHATGTAGGNPYIRFRYGSGNIGSITQSGTTAVQYNTSSDQRLKDNIVDAPSASDDIDAIQVRSFDWKADGSHQKYGMVAQELQSVAPEAVSQGETEEDMMGVDYSKLVPMMLKEIQSLRARVAQLEGEN